MRVNINFIARNVATEAVSISKVGVQFIKPEYFNKFLICPKLNDIKIIKENIK